MDPETEEKKAGLVDTSNYKDENMFNMETYEREEAEEEEEELKNFPDFQNTPEKEAEQQKLKDEEEAEEEEEDDDDKINFEGTTKEEKIDLEIFNKKFDKDFKSEEELKAFLDGKDQEIETDSDDELLDKANSQIEMLEPILPLNDEDLMRKQFETIAMNDNKNLNDEDVKIDIEEQIQELKDGHLLDVKANMLRTDLKKMYAESKNSKKEIEGKRETIRLSEEKITKEKLQAEFIKLDAAESFYGIDLDRKTIAEVYQNVSSGKFIEELKSNKQAIAELALMFAYKEKIFKKASGLTYSDGLKAVLDDYKSKPKADTFAKAQRSKTGSTASSDKLIEGILYEKPKEKTE